MQSKAKEILSTDGRKWTQIKTIKKSRHVVSFVGWARFFAHAEQPVNTWAKKRAHPTITTKEIAFYLRSSAFICGLYAFNVFDCPQSVVSEVGPILRTTDYESV